MLAATTVAKLLKVPNSCIQKGISDFNGVSSRQEKIAEKNKVKFLASEQKLYSKLHWTAGTADFLCKIDGQTYLGDIKTSSGIYDRTPFAQCASYRMMLKEMTGKECDGSIIVNIKKYYI